MTAVAMIHIGGPTALIRAGEWTLLTDPTFDPPGGSYQFGRGTGSKKLAGHAIAVDDLPPIDAVLLSHDQHDDNLDAAGRALLPEAEGRSAVEITATPCRRPRLGPPAARRHLDLG